MTNLIEPKIIYPETDGLPMANNTRHGEWIIFVKENLEILFSDREDIFLAVDVFWYPQEGNNKVVVAPDLMIAFGRPKGHRASYLQWQENNVPISIVFEFISPCNSRREMGDKLEFFNQYGVIEYYIYDYDKNRLEVYIRNNNILAPVSVLRSWISPLLQVKMEISTDRLQLYFPDGSPFLTAKERENRWRNAERELIQFRHQTIVNMRKQGLSDELIANILNISTKEL